MDKIIKPQNISLVNYCIGDQELCEENVYRLIEGLTSPPVSNVDKNETYAPS